MQDGPTVVRVPAEYSCATSITSLGMIPIFVINLARDRERLHAMKRNMQLAGLTFERVEAFDGRRFTPRVQRLLNREFFSPTLNRRMTHGEVGCSFSHVRALRLIIQRSLPAAIVLEDDVEFTVDFATFVREELPRLLLLADVIKLEGRRDQRSSRAGLRLARTSVGELFIPLRPALGSAGYAVNAPGARALFRAFKRIDRPLDHRLAAYDLHGAVYAEFTHFPVAQTRLCSNIEAERNDLATVTARRSLGRSLRNKGRKLVTVVRRSLRIIAVLLQRRPSARMPKVPRVQAARRC